jgi:hypothetical protein
MWDFKFSRRRVWCSELSSGIYCRENDCRPTFQRCVLPPSSGLSEPSTKGSRLYRSQDLGGQSWWETIGKEPANDRGWEVQVGERYIGRVCQVDEMQPLEGPHWKPGMVSMWSGSDGSGGGLCCPEKDRCTNYSLGGGFLRALRECISGFHDRLRTRPSSLFILFGWSSIPMASLISRSMYLDWVDRQYAPLKRRSTIILHGSISQKTTLNIESTRCLNRLHILLCEAVTMTLEPLYKERTNANCS